MKLILSIITCFIIPANLQFLTLTYASTPTNRGKTEIIVDYDQEKGTVNRRLFGMNLLGYAGSKGSSFGFGIWDPFSKKSIKELINILKSLDVRVLRFPGGCGTHIYNWKLTIGRGRKTFLFGLDEFLKICTEIGAEPIITLSYFTGSEIDDADLVEYLNAPDDGSNPNGGVDWARERSKNGHSEPWNVKYFEVGNEVYHGNHDNIRMVTAEDYAERYLRYWKALKKVDPDIKIGVVLYKETWNQKVLSIIKEKVDFGVLHIYPSPKKTKRELKQLDPKQIFQLTFQNLESEVSARIKITLKLLEECSGRKVPLAITEYNAKFVQDEPVPYRHSLGTALVNARLLEILLLSADDIIFANYWNFANEYWGMVSNSFDGTHKTLHDPYFMRPNYFVFEFYYKYLGDIILAVTNVEDQMPGLFVNASKSKDGKKVFLIIVNENIDNNVAATFELKGFEACDIGDVRILNGPSIDSTNEINRNLVRVTSGIFSISGNKFEFVFEPHSLTAIEISKK